eukprot:scaffold2901_cov91-Skeletonema_dohrnii-CCMP3373.AAC.3
MHHSTPLCLARGNREESGVEGILAHDVIIPDGVIDSKACSLTTTPIVSFLSDCRAFDFLFELFDFQASVLYSDSSSRPLRPLDP